ncbi:24529_t:CDS:2, partial [Gigaspora margarita]
QHHFNDDDNVAILLEDLLAETDLGVQELSNNIEEYIQMIDQTVVTEDVLTDEELPPLPITITEAVEVLEKVIRYQEGLDVGKGFNKNGLIKGDRGAGQSINYSVNIHTCTRASIKLKVVM